MGSQIVTCHPAAVTFPNLPTTEAGTRFSDPGGMQVDLGGGQISQKYPGSTVAGNYYQPDFINIAAMWLDKITYRLHIYDCTKCQ